MPRIEDHFAEGLVVEVRRDALPAGLEHPGASDVGDSSEYVPDGPRQITAVSDDGTVEVSSWWWYPQDVRVVGLP